MNAVGIDVSKGKPTVAILRPGGEVVASPFAVSRNPRELNGLVALMESSDGDTKIVMEYIGNYYLPVALFLQKSGFASLLPPYFCFCLFSAGRRNARSARGERVFLLS